VAVSEGDIVRRAYSAVPILFNILLLTIKKNQWLIGREAPTGRAVLTGHFSCRGLSIGGLIILSLIGFRRARTVR